jgi:hypothetical protein
MTVCDQIKHISFYIPRVRSRWEWESLSNYFDKEIQMGKVYRIDFIPFKQKELTPTDKDYYFINPEEKFISAFVHFSYLYQNERTKKICSEIEETGQSHHIVELLEFENSNPQQEWWYIKKSNTPIFADEYYNNAQLCEFHRLLEIKVNDMNNLLIKQQEIIEKQQSQLEELMTNKSSKIKGSSDTTEDMNINSKGVEVYSISPHSISPHSISTHSSMPSLVSDSPSSTERLGASETLCGNN